jgi:mono/diheme cytochrome c family protein
MPPYLNRLSDAEVAAVVNYARQRWGRATRG